MGLKFRKKTGLYSSIIVSVALLLFACSQQRSIKSIEQIMKQSITVSPTIGAVWKGKDTILSDFMETPIKLIIWHDSLACTSCEMSKMYEWKYITAYADSLSQWLSIIFLFTPKKNDLDRVNIALKFGKFDYPIFIDQNSAFVKQNPKLPKNRQLHSFLLDKNNRVVMVGNPLYNPTLWELYKRTIQKMIDNDGVLPEP